MCVSCLYELCAQKYRSSVQVVYSGTLIYIYKELCPSVYACVGVNKNFLNKKVRVRKSLGVKKAPFRCPERKFGISI